MKKALLIIDMLKDFVYDNAPLRVPKAKEIIPNIQKEIERARREGIPVIYVCDSHKPDDPEFKVWPPHAIEGTEGAEVIDELKPQKDDILVCKSTYSGFYKTELEEILKREGVDTLIITGVLTNICVLYTAVDGLMRGYEVIIPDGCVIGVNDEDHRFALRQIREVLKPRR